jgi:hypothetical protein
MLGEVCLEITETSSPDVSLAVLIGKSYDFAGSKSKIKVFQAKIRSQHAVWMPSAEVDALFRLKAVVGMVILHRVIIYYGHTPVQMVPWISLSVILSLVQVHKFRLTTLEVLQPQ